jgi:hypothetical protein
MTATYIKPLNSAIFAASQAVVMTAGFTQDANLWNYYEPYPAGLHMGVSIRDLTIDGNRANVANANGLMIYGGKWRLDGVGVINTSGHGIWTECGSVGSSILGDDLDDYLNMHESTAGTIFLSNNDKHGWFYRGPNDSRIDNVQIKISGWAAFYQDDAATINAGGIKIGTLHPYACQCDYADNYMVVLHDAIVDRLYADSSAKGGVLLKGNQTQINQVLGFLNNQTFAGDYYTVLMQSASNQIGILRDRANNFGSGAAGGALKISGQYNIVENVRLSGAGTVAATAINITGDNNMICGGGVFGYNMVNGKGLTLNSSANYINLHLASNEVGFNYLNSGKGRNRINLTFQNNTTDTQLTGTISGSDQLKWASDKQTEAVPNIRSQSPTFAASYTPDPSLGAFIQIALSGNITIDPPSGLPRAGDELEFRFLQDATGGRTVTWDATFKNSYSNTGNTASKELTIRFRYTGIKWMQVGASSGWI